MTADDIEKYRALVDGTSDRLRDLCDRWAAEMERDERALNEEVAQRVHSAVGKSQLLRTSKFVQFRGFLEDAAAKTVGKPVLLDDVRGFWETIYIQVDEVLRSFDELDRLKANDYVVVEESATVVDGAARKAPKKQPAAAACPKKPAAAASSNLRSFISAQRERKKLDEVRIVETVPSNGHV